MAKIRVVLAEDHTIVRKGLRALLKDVEDIKVVGEAADGREAVQLTSEILPDVVVIDISMPLLNGLEATRRITERHPEVNVVVLTVHSNEEYILRTFQSGAVGYLVKASAPAELVRAIRAANQGLTFLSPSISRKVVQELVHNAENENSQSDLNKLTGREREVLQLVAEGYSIKEISDHLYLSQKTVRTHRSNLMKKLDVSTTASLTLFALQQGVITLEG